MYKNTFILFVLFSIYNTVSAQNIGVNITSPLHPLHVNQVSGTSLGGGMPVIFSEYSGTNPADVIGIKGYSRPLDYYGIGGHFEGGWRGLEGVVNPTGNFGYFGVLGSVNGGTGTNYGIFGTATGSGTNYAGYFDSGNVYVNNRLGIGQLSPLWPLDMSADQAVARMVTTTSANGSVVELKNTSALSNFLGAINFNNNAGGVPGQIAYESDDEMTFRTANSEQLRVNASGYVGIGSQDPLSWLDIWRNSSSNLPHLTLREADVDYARMNFKIGLLPFEWAVKAFPSGITEDADFVIQYTGQSVSGTRLQIKGTGEVVIPLGLDASYSTNGYLMLGDNTNANITFDDNEILARNNGGASGLWLQRDGGDLVLCELENGIVRIGSTPSNLPTDPSYILAVGGKAVCEELKVQLQGNWPDYVFNSNYALKPLEDLENEILSIGHLPGMPSAQEAEKAGIELGEMQRLLLEKVEELTLYVIELKKENVRMQSELNQLKNQ